MNTITFIVIVAALTSIFLFILLQIGRQFRKFDVVDEELYRREMLRQAQELKEAGIITSVYDFMVGVNRAKNPEK